jgi:hypothetical protein
MKPIGVWPGSAGRTYQDVSLPINGCVDCIDYTKKARASCGSESSGPSWQIVPDVVPRLLADLHPARAELAMQAILGMKSLDIAAHELASEGTGT